MEKKIKELYGKLISEYTKDKLQQLSVQIIDAYKNGKKEIIDRFAKRIMINPADYINKSNRLFMKIIVFYHPDKYNSIINNLNRYYKENNLTELQKYARYIALPEYYTDRETSDRYEFEYKEEYGYGREDFRDSQQEYRWNDFHDFEDDNAYQQDDRPIEYGFIEVVKYMMYGNRDIDFLAKDLYCLEGELDLSYSDIEDLDGAEYCVNVVSMDLSGNSISNIYPLKSLPYLSSLYLSHNEIYDIGPIAELTPLKALDLSYNEIENIESLLELPDLEYVNLIGNKIIGNKVLETLRERNVIVIY